MKTTHRDYSEEQGDFVRLSRFIFTHAAFVRSHSTWCIGRFADWKYGLWGSKPETPFFCERNAHLWFDGFGELAGFVISENGGPEFAILTPPGTRFLFAEMLDWTLEHWNERGPKRSIEITALQELEAAALEARGFRRDSAFFTNCFDLTGQKFPHPVLEAGFSIVDMASYPDYRAQRILRADGFSGRSDLSEAELARDLALIQLGHQNPIYHPDTDLCVMAPDGSFVSGCEALIDTHTCEADIERVCTHSAYRRRGFARAAILECLVRLQELGLRRAYITGYSQAAIDLYSSMGSIARTEALVYTQPSPASPKELFL